MLQGQRPLNSEAFGRMLLLLGRIKKGTHLNNRERHGGVAVGRATATTNVGMVVMKRGIERANVARRIANDGGTNHNNNNNFVRYKEEEDECLKDILNGHTKRTVSLLKLLSKDADAEDEGVNDDHEEDASGDDDYSGTDDDSSNASTHLDIHCLKPKVPFTGVSQLTMSTILPHYSTNNLN